MAGGGRARPRRPDGRILAFVLCCALLAVGCTHRSGRSGEPGAGAGAATPRSGGTLRIALVTPGPLDPAQAVSAERRLLVGNLFDSLTTLDADGAVRPAAAASWSGDQTLRHWRFQLRPGGRYADGQPVQARDFKAAWERLANPRTRPRPAAPAALLGLVDGYQAMAAGRTRSISGLSAPDPATLVVDLSQPFADFPTVVADPRLSPLPPKALARGASALAARPIGNGPFMLAKPQGGKALDLVRNPRYAGRAAYLDRVRVRVVPDQQTAWLAFQHGQVSFAPVPPDQVAAARLIAGASGDGRGRPGLLQGPELGTWSIGFDPHSKQGSDPRWRRAVSLALDRSSLAAAFQGAVVPAAGIVPAGVRGARQTPCPSCVHDPGQAGALLDLIGDGARKPVVMAVAATAFDREVAAIVAQQLAKVGLPVEVKEVRGALGPSAVARAQLLGSGQAADFPRIDPFLAGLQDGRVQSLVAQARRTADQTARTRIYQRAEQAALDAADVVPVVQYQHTAVLAPGVEGFDLTPWSSVDLSACSLANWAK
ncbi:MAG TPA: ABC transporter substrate-binding protein [Actinomycetes bacterium]|nr:ABC transporter substrate-binding protein [Actinomycetes bacterium]